MLTADGTCSTCCRPPSSPWRVYGADGKVIHGCIDDAHTGRLVSPSESAWWHGRPEARAHRARVKRDSSTVRRGAGR